MGSIVVEIRKKYLNKCSLTEFHYLINFSWCQKTTNFFHWLLILSIHVVVAIYIFLRISEKNEIYEVFIWLYQFRSLRAIVSPNVGGYRINLRTLFQIIIQCGHTSGNCQARDKIVGRKENRIYDVYLKIKTTLKMYMCVFTFSFAIIRFLII